jgi:hypothetical protein
MLTLISPNHLKTIIQLSGQAIREFLSQADAGQFKGEAKLAITSFQSNPLDFSDEKLVAYGSDTVEAINYPVRIEVRGVTQEGIAQMVAKGIWGPKRVEIADQISQKCKKIGLSLDLRLAGTSSIEFNVGGVNKSVPILFLQVAFEDVLKEMNYQPGAHIDSRQTKTVIAADGDGTIYDGPRVGILPTLAESPVRDVLCAYLQAGGIFMLISGNDINRTFKRLVDALPKEVYCRVLVCANGGAELVYVNSNGQAVPVSSYRKHALGLVQDKSHRHVLDMVYIGDDGSKEGNDYPAFKAIGFKNSVLVSSEFLSDYDPALEPCYVGGLLQGTRKFLEHFLSGRMGAGGKVQDSCGGACCGDL